jgi:hypothetical protein
VVGTVAAAEPLVGCVVQRLLCVTSLRRAAGRRGQTPPKPAASRGVSEGAADFTQRWLDRYRLQMYPKWGRCGTK